MFNDKLTNHLTSILLNISGSIILGDFNMHVDDVTDTEAIIFNDTMTALGLDQHVMNETHNKGNVLDLIFTEITMDIKFGTVRYGPYVSDHRLTIAETNQHV